MSCSRSCLAIVLALGALSAMATTGCGKSAAEINIPWQPDVEGATSKAKAENKPLFVYFGAAWDTAAKELELQTFTDRNVRTRLMRDFVSVHVDTTDDEGPFTRRLQERFRVVGDPTIVILAADGTTELARFNEYITPAVLLRALETALGKDAVREARFEAAARRRAAEARNAEQLRQYQLQNPPPPVILVPEPSEASPAPRP